MRKLIWSLLLLFVGVTMKAQTPTFTPVSTLNDITTGWYQIKFISSDDNDEDKGLVITSIANATNFWLNCDEEFRQNSTSFYALKFGGLASDKPAKSFIHIDNNNASITGTSASFVIQSINGHYVNSDAKSQRGSANNTIEQHSAGEFSVTGFAVYSDSAGSETPYIGKSGSMKHHIQLSKVDETDYEKYTVTFAIMTDATEIRNDASLTCTSPKNKGIAEVYNHGTFFFEKGYVPVASDFTASTIAGCDAEIYVEGTTIKVVYSASHAGYYKIKSAARTDRYLVNVAEPVGSYAKDHTYNRVLPTLLTNNYIWKLGRNGTAAGSVFTLLNGQGTPIKAHESASSYIMNPLTVKTKVSENQFEFNENLNRESTDDDKPVHKYGQDDIGTSKNQWIFEEVTGTAYDVRIVNAPAGTTVAHTSSGAKAYNGGFFFYETGAPAETDFTASHVEGYTSDIDIVGTTITVTYAFDLTESKTALAEHIEEATLLRDTRGVGYPKETSDAYRGLNSAIETAEAVYAAATTENELNDAITTVVDAISTYKHTTTIADLQMPEPGKAYTITNVHVTGKNDLQFYFENEALQLSTSKITENKGVFICAKDGDKYVFVNATGGYLAFKYNTNQGINSGKGYYATYDAGCEAFDMSVSGNNLSSTDSKAFGTFTLFVAHRNGGTSGTAAKFDINESGAFGVSSSNSQITTLGNYTGLFRIEEVPNFRNAIPLRRMNSTEYYVGTYSAPYATVIPEGVTAYAVASTGSNYVTTESLTGNVIPASTGVLLSASSEMTAYMAPATTEGTGTEPVNNLLVGTGASTVASGTGKYILGSKSGIVAFYQSTGSAIGEYRAYLNISGAQAQTMRFNINFDDMETGIDNIEDTESSNTAIYDLSGRHVQSPIKGGFYIKNGVKYVHQ